MYALGHRPHVVRCRLALVVGAALVASLVALVPRAAGYEGPTINVQYSYDFGYSVGMHLSGFTAGSTVDLQIYAADGSLLASRTVPSDFDTCCTSDALGLGFDMTPGMEVVVTDNAMAVVKTLTLAHFTIDRVDPVSDTVSGTAPPGAGIWVNGTNTEWGPAEFQTSTTARDDGTWSVDLAPFAAGWSAQVEAGTWDDEGDGTGAMGRPAWIDVRPASDAAMPSTVIGYYWGLSSTVSVEVRSGLGAPVWSGSASTNDGRAFVLDLGAQGVHLAPGMHVTVGDPAVTTKELTIEPVTIDLVDPSTSRVAGTATPGRTVDLYLKCPCWDGGGLAGTPTAGADTGWSFVNPRPFDATIESWVDVLDPEYDATEVGQFGPLVPTGQLTARVTVCDGMYYGTGKDVSVPSGASCTLLPGTTVGHDLTVARGGSLVARGITVGHDLTLDAGASSVCASAISHDLTVHDGTAPILIGDTAGGCAAGNTVGHDLVVQHNSAPVDVGYNTVGHDMSVRDNTGGAIVNRNKAGHDAVCVNNHPQAGSGNTAVHSNTCPA